MTRQHLLAAWGVTTTAGWLLTHWIGTSGATVLGLGVTGSVLAVWAALMAVPVGMTLALRPVGLQGGVWAALVAAGLAENGVVARLGGEHDHSAHGHGTEGHGADGHGAGGHDGADHDAAGGHDADGHADEGDGGGHDSDASVGGQSDGHGDHDEAAGSDHGHESGDHGASDHGGAEGPTDPAPATTTRQHADGSAHEHAASSAPDSSASGAAADSPAPDAVAPDSAGAHAATHDATGAHDGADAPLISGDVQHVSYYHVWFAIGAVGFAVSAVQAEGSQRKALYALASALNAAMVLLLVVYPPVQDAAFLVAAAIQGVPMLADLPLRQRAHAVPSL